jgi:hypothetical protein
LPTNYGGFAAPDTEAYDSFDEQHVFARLEQLRPDPKLIEETDALIEMLEKALKKATDSLSRASVEPKEEVLRGVIRTGVLGDRLLFKADREVTAVLLCKDIPTLSLLQNVISAFVENIEVCYLLGVFE